MSYIEVSGHPRFVSPGSMPSNEAELPEDFQLDFCQKCPYAGLDVDRKPSAVNKCEALRERRQCDAALAAIALIETRQIYGYPVTRDMTPQP